MIRRKIILDKRGIVVDKVLTVVLVAFVIVLALGLLFRADINNFLRNILPEYSLGEDEKIIGEDEESEDDWCPVEIGKIGEFEGGKQYIYFGGEKTDLYWDADEKEGYIKISKGGARVAEVKEGIVSVNSDFFNSDSEFDFDSEGYQKIRFTTNFDVSYLVKIHKSYYAGSNFLCKDEEDDVEVDYGFPENPIVLSTESLNLEWKREGIFFNKLKIDFSPYVILPEDSHLKFLYIESRKGYLEIKGAITGFDKKELGRIYPDGSVWLDREKLTEKRPGFFKTTLGAEINKEVVQEYRGIYNKPYYESNLRVDYEEIKKIL